MTEAPLARLPAPFADAETRMADRARGAARIGKLVDRITSRALKHAEACLKQPDEPGYNAQGDALAVDATVRTKFAMQVYGKMMDARREREVTERTLGVLVLKERMREGDWEAHAKAVDEAERVKAIDVEAVKQ